MPGEYKVGPDVPNRNADAEMGAQRYGVVNSLSLFKAVSKINILQLSGKNHPENKELLNRNEYGI
jgi:hypothetical protein